MKLVTLRVRDDNNMYLFYNNSSAICFDLYDFEFIKKALSIKEFKKDLYSNNSEFSSLDNLSTPRELKYVFYTHSHFDHYNPDSKIFIYFSTTTFVSSFKHTICSNLEEIQIEDLFLKCIATPCHTMDSFCYFVKTENKKYLFTGDTLFFLGCGKFFEGNALDMCNSIRRIVENVDADTECKYGHDYNNGNIVFTESICLVPEEIKMKKYLTLEEEIKFNLFVKAALGENLEECAKNLGKLRTQKNSFVS